MLKKDAFNFPKKILKFIWNGVLGYNSDRKVWSHFFGFENYDPRTSLGITTLQWLLFGKKKYVWVAFRVWKLASPWVFVSEDPISFIYRCEKAEKLFDGCRHSFRRSVFSFIFTWRKKAFLKWSSEPFFPLFLFINIICKNTISVYYNM